MAITAEHERIWSIQGAKERDWPVNINFARLPTRILAMNGKLDDLVSNRDARKNDIVWETFEASMKTAKTSLKAFAKLKAVPIKMFSNSRPG